MTREKDISEVDLPAVPESTRTDGDNAAPTTLTLAETVPVEPYVPSKTTPWTEGTGSAPLTAQTEPGTAVPVTGGLPISLGVPEGGDASALAGDWTVALASPEASHEAGVSGLIMKVTPPAGADPNAVVELNVDTSGFVDYYGPEAAQRFGFMLLPDCVFPAEGADPCPAEEAGGLAAMSGAEDPAGPEGTDGGTPPERLSSTVELVPAADAPGDPEADENRTPRTIVSGKVSIGKLRADTTAEPAAAGADGSTVTPAAFSAAGTGGQGGTLSLLDVGSSAGGDYTASPLLSSGSWSAGASSGAFTYAYQVQVPETAGGLTPKVNLSYSSQSVDGRTSASNNQASWIGDGWDYNVGSITRSYASCTQDSKKTGSNNKTHRTADMCWGSNNATLTLGGSTTELVWDAGKKEWFTANGDGSSIEVVTGEGNANGARDDEYWIVTTRDGTKYHFGKHHLPGWTDGKAVTDSVLTVPVYGNHPGEPCFKENDWANSGCTQGWRWNLDYVEDIHGNAMSLWWKKEQNHYARNFDFKKPVPYDRGGYLARIDYGQRKGTLFTAAAPASVEFTVGQRCLPKNGLTCNESDFTNTNPEKYRIWYDTPADLYCASGKMCMKAGPTFWSRMRLSSITTKTLRQKGSTSLQPVDTYQLSQDFPTLVSATGGSTALWLESIQRTGHGVDGTSEQLNSIRFEHNVERMDNRVKRDNRPGFARLRIQRVINEYGGETYVSYKKPVDQCETGAGLPDKTDTAALKANERLCYPSFWHPDPEEEQIDWFQKYVVESVEELPNMPGAQPTLTQYKYGKAGWKLADGEFTKKSTRTYSQFAGFDQTTVLTGGSRVTEDSGEGTAPGGDEQIPSSPQSKTVTRYFRGMGDDRPVTSITGAEIAKDHEAFAGRIAEELTYTGSDKADSDWLTRSYTVPHARELGSRTRDDGLDPLRAWRVTEPEEYAVTKSSGTGDDKRTERTVRTSTTYDTETGLPTRVESFGDTGLSGDESCTRLDYYPENVKKHLVGLTQQVLVSPTTCDDATFGDWTTLSSGTRTAYDHGQYGAAIADTSLGEATQTWSLKADGSGFQSDGTVEFDSLGRVTKQIDADGNFGTLSYEETAGQVYKVTETNAALHTQIQELEPGRGVTLRSTDPNGHVSTAAYDPLGRLTDAWAAGRQGDPVPDFHAVYTIPKEEDDPDDEDPKKKIRKPPYITTSSRGHDGRITSSVTLYDGLGRERQSQEQADGGGHLITDTLYDSSGEVRQTNNAYLTADAKPGELFTATTNTQIPNITKYAYDGLGRVVKETPYLKYEDPNTHESSSRAYEDRATRYEYGPDWSKVINPQGASSYRVFTDALGRTVRTDTFHGTGPESYTSTRYTFDRQGRLTWATKSADPDHPFGWTYDQRGRVVTATDPDTGVTRTDYDERGRVETVTTARGTVWNGYDKLGRPVQQRIGGSDGTVLSDLTYDTAPGGKGLPATATRYTDGQAYTQKVNGYTKDYQPTSTTLSLPQTIADTWGLAKDYTYGYGYSDTGLLEEAQLPAVGKLAAEKLIVRYNEDGLPLSVSGKDWYGTEAVYSPFGQLLRSTLGAQPYRVWTLNQYDESSGALTGAQVYREKASPGVVNGNLVSNRAYTYDPAGNVASIQEQSVGVDERQCFTYDPLGRLKTAWTAKEQNSCAVTATDGTRNVGAGADKSGYWHEYEYDLLGNRTKLTEKDLGGVTAKDAVTTYTYGKGEGTAKTQPGTLTKVTKDFTTPAGAAVHTEVQRLYELTGETRSITSADNGDEQSFTWTQDGKVDRITGQGTGGRTPYVGPANMCIDLKSGVRAAGQPLQLYSCNASGAQNFAFTAKPGTKTVPQPDRDLGTLSIDSTWCLQPAANTAGSAVQIQSCNGAAGQQLKRNSTTGQFTHVSSGLCVAVEGGATALGTPLVLAACSTTSSAQKWSAQNDTRHIYGPDGSRLLTIKGAQATLHLGESEVTVQKLGVLVNTQRTYSVPGGSVMRFAYGTGGEQLVAQTGDHQGSTYAEVALSGTMPVRIRKQDPFGNERGTTAGVPLQSHKGFLGATRDDASGFQPLGARLYDPVVGRFLSADPVLDLNDPLQSNGYAYAHNNPVTFSDPTGLAITLTPSETAAALAGIGLSAAEVSQAQATMGKSLSSVILSAAWSALKDFIGINDALACFGGDMWSCGSLIIGAIPWTKLGKIPSVLRAIDRTIGAIQAFRKAKAAAEAVLKAAKAAEAAALRAKKAAIEKAKKEAAQRAKKKAAEQAKRTADKAVQQTKKTGNPVHKQAQAKAAPKVSSASKGGGKAGASKGSGSKPGGSTGSSSRSKGGSSGGGSGKADGGGGSCRTDTNSFVPGTEVVMADGSTKPIERVRAGDRIVATDPRTGATRAETVTSTIRGQGEKRLVEVVIDTDGTKGAATSAITATDGHPFWVPALGKWVDATDLTPGQWLRTSAGGYVQIDAVTRWTARNSTVHNLTVGDLHTYYVRAGSAPVLVHNCGLSNEEEAEHAYVAADTLQQGRYRATNETISGVRGDQGTYGTTAVIGVLDTNTGEVTIRTSVNHDGPAPDSWPKWARDAFVQGTGHAEMTILNSLAPHEQIAFGAASRNVCNACHGGLSAVPGIVFGGGQYPGGHKASPFRKFWMG
ncbi:ricin-type beta-trefoil lectin domain protein [Streptomyces hydrogenans]|uniref:ricin-type beta-trefoil lectin domain protein n=1 Tax=Streptomyces hydrogenans TaxID=1873719 RepID=UPI0037FA9952